MAETHRRASLASRSFKSARGARCVWSRVSISHVHSVRERRMWVLRDLSVSAARPRAVFLIRPFANRPRHCAIVAYYIYIVPCVIGSLITPPNGGSRQSLSSVFTDLSIYIPILQSETEERDMCRTSSRYLSLGHCNISQKSHARGTENSGYSEKIFNRRYLYNYIDQDILLEYCSDFHYNISIYIYIYIY